MVVCVVIENKVQWNSEIEYWVISKNSFRSWIAVTIKIGYGFSGMWLVICTGNFRGKNKPKACT